MEAFVRGGSFDKEPLKTLRDTTTTNNNKNSSESLGLFQFRTKIVWFNLLGFLFMHIVGLYGLFWGVSEVFKLNAATFLWTALLTFLGGEGIVMGAHRLWTHRSYKANVPMQLVLMALQTLAGQNCAYIWVRDHRQHHKYTDTDADPHNATRGFFFSHIGWLMMKKHPDVIKMGKNISMDDMEANPIVMFQKKWYKPLYIIIAMIMPIVVPIYFWNEDPLYAITVTYFTRYIVQLNVTWSVNSVAHIYGTRPYDKHMLPVDSVFVSFISFGEGWHNYHHAFPWDYKAGEWGKGLNTTRKLIEMCGRFGWAYDLREASQTVVNAKARRLGDGSHIPNGDPSKEGIEDNDVQPADCDEIRFSEKDSFTAMFKAEKLRHR